MASTRQASQGSEMDHPSLPFLCRAHARKGGGRRANLSQVGRALPGNASRTRGNSRAGVITTRLFPNYRRKIFSPSIVITMEVGQGDAGLACLADGPTFHPQMLITSNRVRRVGGPNSGHSPNRARGSQGTPSHQPSIWLASPLRTRTCSAYSLHEVTLCYVQRNIW